MRRPRASLSVPLLVAGVLLGCSGAEPGTASPAGSSPGAGTAGSAPAGAPRGTDPVPASLPPGYEGFRSAQYADGNNWLCHPQDADENVCHRDLTATIVRPDRTTEVEPHVRATAPAVDCFYVYPTISGDPGLNSDLSPADDSEVRALVNQAARLSSVCEVYAPVYRQLTVGSLLQRVSGTDVDQAAMDAARAVAYGDVLDAWKHYIANHNQGRGVILVGHSQGAGHLRRLVREEIDEEPALRSRLVSAYLLGSGVGVPDGKVLGGDFRAIPLCTAVGEVGCVISYASFPASSPPGADSLFGKVEAAGQVAACTNPAALGGGRATVTPYFTAAESQRVLTDTAVAITTPWVSLRGALAAECVVRDGFSILEVTVGGNRTDPRDQVLRGGLPANWGLHLADANLAMGDLVALARAQAEAFTR